MKTQDLERAGELAQEKKEIRFSLFEISQDLKPAREAVPPLLEAVSYGRPGARLELDAAQKHVAELEARAAKFEARLLEATQESANLAGWDAQSASVAREFQLTDEQRETLFEQFKAGKSREQVAREAARLHSENEAAKQTARRYAFQGADDVSW